MSASISEQAFGKHIREWREARGMSVRELTGAILMSGVGVTEDELEEYERGGTVPPLPVFCAAAKVFGLSLDGLANTRPPISVGPVEARRAELLRFIDDYGRGAVKLLEGLSHVSKHTIYRARDGQEVHENSWVHILKAVRSAREAAHA